MNIYCTSIQNCIVSSRQSHYYDLTADRRWPLISRLMPFPFAHVSLVINDVEFLRERENYAQYKKWLKKADYRVISPCGLILLL